MSGNTSRLEEVTRVAVIEAGNWLPIAGFNQVTAYAASLLASSPSNQVTVQLRKATDAAGSNAADLLTAKTGDYGVAKTALAEELGATAGGVPYTHVTAVITDEASPDAASGVLVFSESDYNTPQTQNQYVKGEA